MQKSSLIAAVFLLLAIFMGHAHASCPANAADCSPVSARSVTTPNGDAISTTATGGNTARALASRANDPGFSVLETGAKCDGTTDDTAAFVAAFATSNRRITIPANATCYSATGITLPNGYQLSGGSFSGQPSPPGSGTSTILCDAAVAACVTLNGGMNGSSAGLDNLSVQTNATTTMTSGKCIYVHAGQNAQIENVSVYNCYDGFYFRASPGLTAYLNNIFSGRIYDAHVVQDTFAELRITNARFGINGLNDVPSQTYIRVTGGNPSSIAAGPNGLHVINAQFNQGGGGTINHVIEFVNCTAAPNCNQLGGDFIIDDSWSEAVSQAVIYSDASWPLLTDIRITNSGFNGLTEKFLDLNPNTRIGFGIFSNIYAITTDFTYAPSVSAFSNLTISNARIVGPVSISSAYTGSVLSINNLNPDGGLTLAGTWQAVTVVGGAGTLTDTSTATYKAILQNIPPSTQPRDAANPFGGSLAVGKGAMAGAPTSGALNGNTAVGFNVMGLGPVTTASTNNSAFGNSAMSTATSAANTAAFGSGAIAALTTGNNNSGFGEGVMALMTTGNRNSIVGTGGLAASQGGSDNTCAGWHCLFGLLGFAPGSNTAFGVSAGSSIVNGASNLVLGPSVASTTLSGGSSNVLIGTSSAVDTPLAGTSNYLNIQNIVKTTGTNTPTTAVTTLSGIMVLPDLPTSCSGKVTGTLWNNSNVLNVCP